MRSPVRTNPPNMAAMPSLKRAAFPSASMLHSNPMHQNQPHEYIKCCFCFLYSGLPNNQFFESIASTNGPNVAPWGKGEFTGAHADGHRTSTKPDGTFCMTLDDFRAIFSRVDLCRTFATRDNATSWYQLQEQGEITNLQEGRGIKGSVCGTATSQWFHNPRYQLRLQEGEKTKIVVSLTQPDTKFIEGQHFFKRSEAPNAPLIWRIQACREFLDSQGYPLPPLQPTSSDEGQD